MNMVEIEAMEILKNQGGKKTLKSDIPGFMRSGLQFEEQDRRILTS